ncbi:divalent-cation tolerance protein CutA [Methanoregula sp.]|uniref:divalent-cation tolerance protein CutA n=1 Tax=Methanoregula sp. TaxID=2052170 RepID=UPI003C777F1A
MVETGSLEPVPEICVIFSTVPVLKSQEIARALLDRHLVACVNLMPVRSWYRWKGGFCDDEEHLLVLKTRKEMAETVIRELKALHPYEVPEIIVLPVTGGHLPYLAWVHEETQE